MQIKKSQGALLEDKKLIFALMGFIFVLTVCFIALEWTKKDVKVFQEENKDAFYEEEMDIQQTVQETPPPPPEPVEIPQEVEDLVIVENDEETEAITINTEDNNDAVVIAPPAEVKQEVEEEEDEQIVFKIVETMPEFPGGQQALFKFLSENVKYPVIAQENGIQGKVICQFTVNKDGSIVDVKVANQGRCDASLEKEAIRVVKSMPKWHPGKQRGKAVRVTYTVPVSFKLQ